MAFKKSPQLFGASVNEVTLGTGDRAIVLGGENVLPLYTFDAAYPHKPAIGAEITDAGFDASVPGIAAFYEGCTTLAETARRVSEMPGADFVVLTLSGGDPSGANRSVEELLAAAVEVAGAIDCPLAIQGCRNIEKDKQLFEKIAEALQGRNIAFLSAREEDYKELSAAVGIAYGQKLSAESAVDINLAKQLNVLMSQIGLKPENHLMNIGAAAAGYGYEYVASTYDRVRGAALAQNDTSLQMPIITPVADEAWAVKEAIVSEDELPEWGPRENRGIQMETATAAAALAGGADAVILRHPETVATIARLIAELM